MKNKITHHKKRQINKPVSVCKKYTIFWFSIPKTEEENWLKKTPISTNKEITFLSQHTPMYKKRNKGIQIHMFYLTMT